MMDMGHEVTLVHERPHSSPTEIVFHLAPPGAAPNDLTLGIDESPEEPVARVVKASGVEGADAVTLQTQIEAHVNEYIDLLRPRHEEAFGPPVLALNGVVDPRRGAGAPALPPLVLRARQTAHEAASRYCTKHGLSRANVPLLHALLHGALMTRACAPAADASASTPCFARRVAACRRHLGDSPYHGYELARPATDGETYALLRRFAALVPPPGAVGAGSRAGARPGDRRPASAPGPTCVETGTWQAESTLEMAEFCSTVWTIELDAGLAAGAAEKALAAGVGDSLHIGSIQVDGEPVEFTVGRDATNAEVRRKAELFCAAIGGRVSALGDSGPDPAQKSLCPAALTQHLEAGRARIEEAGRSRVHVLHGDSAEVLASELFDAETMPEPALFWLDGHWTVIGGARGPEDSPVLQELEAIFARNNDGDVVLIDDIRTMRGDRLRQRKQLNSNPLFPEGRAPPELRTVLEKVCELRPHWLAAVEGDVLKLHAPHLVAEADPARWTFF
jgi:hypothetical protein